jgi:hypothetical protein
MLSVAVEALTGAALLVAPSFVARLLLGGGLSPEGTAVGRVCALALLSLAAACWPQPVSDDRTAAAFRGMFPYNAIVGLFLGYLWVRGNTVGPLLLLATIFHLVMTILLAVLETLARRSGSGETPSPALGHALSLPSTRSAAWRATPTRRPASPG